MDRNHVHSGGRSLLASLAALGLVGVLALPTLASGTTPKTFDDWPTAAQDCWELLNFDSAAAYTAAGGEQFKPNSGNAPTAGVHGDGTLSVTISSLTSSSFTWSSNIGVDAVYVKGGQSQSRLYWYDHPDDPGESTGGTGLTTVSGGAISHVVFCYDQPDSTPTPTPTDSPAATPTPTPTDSPAATPTPTPTEDEEPAEATPTPTPREDTAGGTPAPPGGAIPDTATSPMTGTLPATMLAMVALASTGALLVARFAEARRRR